MISSDHASLLADALARVLGTSGDGSLAYLRCLPSEAVAGLVSCPEFHIRGFVVHGVVDRDDPERRMITADRAVELREDKGEPLVLLIDTQRAGAGLDGIYSAGREVTERELFEVANELARRRLGHGRIGSARDAVRAARRVGRRTLVAPWQEFDFLVESAKSVDVMGGALARLGLWPIAIAEKLHKEELDVSVEMVNRLLFNRDATSTPASRIAGLLLEAPTHEQRAGLERFLREAASLDPLAALRRLEDRPQLWLNHLRPRFVGNELREIVLVPWRNDQGKLLAWSGLHETGEGAPRLVLDPKASGKKGRLEIRWRSVPDGLTKGAATYQVDIVAGEDRLASRTLAHKAANLQTAIFTADDFEHLDESARFEAQARIAALARDDVEPKDTEEFVLEFGQAPGPTESTAGKEVRCLVEGAIILPTAEAFRTAVQAMPDDAIEDKKGYIGWQPGPGVGRRFKVLRPRLIAEVEKDWQAQRGRIGRWSVRVRADGSRAGPIVFELLDQGNCPAEAWERAERASQRLCADLGQGKGLGFLSRIQAVPWPAAQEYLLAWADALEKGPPELALFGTVAVESLSGRTIGLIVTPFHPLRLAWHAAYDLLAAHARYEQGMSPVDVNRVLGALDSAHFPHTLPGLERGRGFVFGDTLGFHAVAMVVDTDPEPKAAIALMAACIAEGRAEVAPSVGARTAEVLAREIDHYLDCHTRRLDGAAAPPDLLQLRACKAGDGMTVARALGGVVAKAKQSGADEDATEPADDLCFVLDLVPSPEQAAVAGQFLTRTGQRHRSGAGQVEPQDRWMLDTAVRPGRIAIPRLKWARREWDDELSPAHLALAFDSFDSRLERMAVGELPGEPRPMHVFGLVATLERQVSLGDEPTWRVYLPPKLDGEKHPEGRGPTERLLRLNEAMLRATVRHLGGTGDDWPVLTTRLSPDGREAIGKLHAVSDWVIACGRNACIEYFDSPNAAPAVYDAYVIDCVPERDDLGSLQLVTSTTNVDEVRGVLDRALAEMGLSGSQRNCRLLLKHLKALSGRLAIRLANPALRAGELVALALVHAQCLERRPEDKVWLALREGFFVPIDEVADLLRQDSADGDGEQRADLVYVTAAGKGPLELRFIAVKYRRHLRTARDPELLELMVAQLRSMRERWRNHFFSDRLRQVGAAVRRSSLVRILHFYLNKAHRHHLHDDTYARLRRQLDRMMTEGDAYPTVLSERPGVGYVFCPELRTSRAEQLYGDDSDGAEIFLFGPALLPELGLGGMERTYRRDGVTPEVEGGEAFIESTIESAAEAESRQMRADTGEEEVAKPITTAPLAPEMVPVILGRNVATGEDVSWRVTVHGNPHLMILGLPGMGKTTTLIAICRQLAAARITPIVFSYHHDIDERLANSVGTVRFIDYQGLGFNPLQVDPGSPFAHIDAAGDVRDIFAAIFPDLGDLQTEEIRQAIKKSYENAGWAVRDETPRPAPPSFQDFYDILAHKPRPNQGLMARLNELNDYGFFATAGDARSLLDLREPCVLRIHGTSNEALQKAFASFVLYSIYKDMFRRGVQARLTHAVVFDEAHRASKLKLLPTMAKECRKYGLALIVASQEVRDFDNSLFSAIAGYLALRLNESDARMVARIASASGLEARVVDRLKQLNKFHALYFTEEHTRPVQIALSP